MSIYVYKNNRQTGPFSEGAVLEMLKDGRLSPNDSAVRQGQSQWQPLRVLFPDAVPVLNNQPLPPMQQQQAGNNQIKSTPEKRGFSKGLLFGLLGLGGFFVLAVIALVGLYFWLGSRSDKLAANKTINSNSTSTESKSSSNYSQANFKALQNKAEEFAKMSPPQQQSEANPVIKGKVVIVEKGEYEARITGVDYTGEKYAPAGNIEKYGIAKVRLAIRPEEIDTLIQILCAKGKFIGRYEGGVSAYASDCKVSIIDYKTPALIAQKSFINSALPKTVSTVYKGGDYITLPSREADEYIASFPLDKLSNPTTGMPVDNDGGRYGKYKSFMDLAGELSRVPFPVKIDSNASLKGKIAYALKEESGRTALKGFDVYGKEIYSYDIERWGVSKDKIAEKPEEIDTLIQVNCKKGDRIGAAKGITVYANQCEVSIVDYKTSTTILQKSFENKEMYRDIDTETYPTGYTVLYPATEIDEFIKGLPKS